MVAFPVKLAQLFALLALICEVKTYSLTHNNGYCQNKIAKVMLKSKDISLYNYGSTGALGSDMIYRPDDEDSPEFAEYLKQLLEMQANRAKNGFAAPSSASADTYMAKLTRIKLERLARRRAGLPDDEVDTSYKPEDYQSAMFEMAEPVVSNTPLTIADAMANSGSGGKVRPLTQEEIRMAKFAEEAALQALEEKKKQGLPINQPKVETTPIPGTLLKKPQVPSGKPVATTTAPIQSPKPVVKENTLQTPPREVSNLKTELINQNVPPSPRTSAGSSKERKSDSGSNLVRKLSKNELEIVGKALELTVKHRGGGPFGPGRLEGSEISQMERSLRAALEVLKVDSAAAEPLKVVQAAVKQNSESDALPALKKAAPASPINKDQVNQPQTQQLKQQKPVSQPNIQKTEAISQHSPQAQPIAIGLDRFLQNPKSADFEELSALRDGLIQALAMVQGEISTVDQRKVSYSATINENPTDRIIAQHFETQSNSSNKGQSSDKTLLEKELKLTLGLLLKHRGGPGFGHGRLDGKELNLMETKLKNIAEMLREEAQQSLNSN